MNTLGERLKEARNKRKLTQVSLEQLSGVPQQTIHGIESQKIKETRHLMRLAKALRINPEWLSTGEGEMEKGTVEHVPSSEYGMGGFRTSENCSGCYGEMLPGRGKGSRTKHSQEISVPGKKALHVKEDRHSSTGSLD